MFMHRYVVILMLVLVMPSLAWSQSLYRYKDENGTTVLNNSIPAKYVAKGYEVIDARTGKVTDKVVAIVQDENVKRVYQSPDDKILLASYSTVKEIAEHLERKLAKLRAEVANIQTDMRVQNIELERQQKELKRLQDREREIPEELLGHITELEGSLDGLAGALERRESDMQWTIDEYEAKSQRFQTLKQADILH